MGALLELLKFHARRGGRFAVARQRRSSHRAGGRRQHGHHGRVFAVERHEARIAKNTGLGRRIGRDVAMPVQVVLRNVQHRRRRGLKARGTVELEARQLQHPYLGKLACVDALRQGIEQRRADIAGHSHRFARMLHQPPGEGGDRGLAVGPRDGQQGRCIAMRRQQRTQGHRIQAQFAFSAYSTSASSYKYRSNFGRTESRRAVHRRQALALNQRGPEGSRDKTHLGQLPLQQKQLRRSLARVSHGDLGTAAHAPARHGQARSAQPQDENVLAQQRP